MLISERHARVFVPKNLHHSSLRYARHRQRARDIMPEIVKLEVRNTQGFREPAKSYCDRIGAQGWQDEGLLIQRASCNATSIYKRSSGRACSSRIARSSNVRDSGPDREAS